MAKLRTCKICGKQYEYCGHCPSKNLIEPWRNLYCSEECRNAFGIMSKYAAGKIGAVEARGKLESFGLSPTKVRDVHKATMVDIFRTPTVVVEKAPSEIVVEGTSSDVIKVDNPAVKSVEPALVLPASSEVIEATEVVNPITFLSEVIEEPKKEVEEKPVFNKPFKKKKNFEKKNNIVNED